MNNELAKALASLHIAMRYGGRPCPHCGIEIEKKDQYDIVVSAGGKYLQEFGVAAHSQCYYVHEANDEWRAAHPECAPKSQ